MLIRFDLTKTIQASAVLLKTSASRRMSRLRLLKLLYIADRETFRESGRPITGDRVVAMKNGPVLSRTYDLIKGSDFCAPDWERIIRNADKWELELIGEPGVGELSKYEIEKLQEAGRRFEECDDWEVAEYTHTFPEWLKNRPEGNTQRDIPLDDLLEAAGLTEFKQDLLAEAEALAAFDLLLAAPRPVKASDTFLVSLAADEHLWMIISDPAIDPQRVLMVNFTSWKPYHDQACVLDSGDHPFLRRRTCVNYRDARVTSNGELEGLLTAKQVFPQQPLSAQLLQRIRERVRGSRMKVEFVQILVDQGSIE